MDTPHQTTVIGVRPCTGIWLALLALTVVTWAAGGLGFSGTGLVLSVLAIAVLKAQMVADFFMGLRRVRGFWRPLVTGYLLFVGGMIALAFLNAG